MRYGNVKGSRGSVIPFFISIKESKELPITDERMTRFMISLEESVNLVWHTFEDMIGGEIYIKKIPSMKIIDIAKIIAPTAKLKIIGIRPGEKLHEQMISSDESFSTFEYKNHYKILNPINNYEINDPRIKNGKKVADGFKYTSDNNKEWMSKEELQSWINLNKNLGTSL